MEMNTRVVCGRRANPGLDYLSRKPLSQDKDASDARRKSFVSGPVILAHSSTERRQEIALIEINFRRDGKFTNLSLVGEASSRYCRIRN